MTKKVKTKNEDDLGSIGLQFAVNATALFFGACFAAAVLAPYVPKDLKQKINDVANTDMDTHRQNLFKQIDAAPENLRKLVDHFVNPPQNPQRHPQKSPSDKCKPEKVKIFGLEFTLPC